MFLRQSFNEEEGVLGIDGAQSTRHIRSRIYYRMKERKNAGVTYSVCIILPLLHFTMRSSKCLFKTNE